MAVVIRVLLFIVLLSANVVADLTFDLLVLPDGSGSLTGSGTTTGIRTADGISLISTFGQYTSAQEFTSNVGGSFTSGASTENVASLTTSSSAGDGYLQFLVDNAINDDATVTANSVSASWSPGTLNPADFTSGQYLPQGPWALNGSLLNVSVTAIPEPSAFLFLGVASLSVAAMSAANRRRRKLSHL